MPAEQREEAIQHKLLQLEQQQSQQLFNNTNNNSNNNSFNTNNQQLPQNSISNQQNFQNSENHVNYERTNLKTIDSNSAQMSKEQRERVYRPLDQVTCFKCGEKGHYANKCPKGHLAFLSSALKELQTKRDSDPEV
jgi:hypothetical protein